MSFDAITWALEHSPVTCPYERLILTCLARRANADGTDAYPSRRTLAAAGLADKSTVTRKLNELEKRGIIREGDQRAAIRIPEHLRPKVYDILIPFSYYSPEQLDRVNRERSDRGLKPLTPTARPDIAPAPPRKPRADKGTKRPAKKAAPAPAPSEGGASSTPLDSPQFEGGASSTRVLEAPEGGASSTPKLSFNSVLSLPADPAVPAEPGNDEREAAAPGGGVPEPRGHQELSPAERIAAEWAAGRTRHGLVTSPSRITAFAKEAEWLLKTGVDLVRLTVAAAVMSSEASWFSLTKQIESTGPSVPAGAGAVAPGGGRRGGELSPEVRAAMAARAARGSGL